MLGIDPGTAQTGFGAVAVTGSRLRALEHGVITTKAADPIAERLAEISNHVAGLIDRIGPDAVALEDLYVGKNPRTILSVGQARGAILAACGRAGVEACGYAPAEIKTSVCGYGRADKNQVMRMVTAMLSLDQAPASDHAADALAAAVCHARVARSRGDLGRGAEMIAELRGRVSRVDAGSVVLDVGGVGYLLSATSSARRLAVDADGAEVTLVTHLHVREDALQLFGFAGAAERELFELLLGVSGIGPKAALAIVSGVCPRSDPAGGGGGRPRALHQHPRDRPQDRRAAGDRPQGQGRIGESGRTARRGCGRSHRRSRRVGGTGDVGGRGRGLAS